MATRHSLIHSIKSILKHNKDGSFETIRKREIELTQMANDIVSSGFKLKNINGLKLKHVKYLNKLWQERELKAETIKNKNAQVRWICEKIGKNNMIPENSYFLANHPINKLQKNRAIELSSIDFTKLNDPFMKAYIHLQRHLGLRREEAIKIKPHLADKGDYLEMQSSWCKGGRARKIPINTFEARKAVDFAKSLVNLNESLIPKEKSFIQQRHYYDKQMQRAGVKNPHGLRHAYAQEKYKNFTGWPCFAAGGSLRKHLSVIERDLDKEARIKISTDMGHGRLEIVAKYLD